MQAEHSSPRVLVTGAGGQLGRYLQSSLLDAGYEVIGVGRRAGAGIDLVADITSIKTLERTITKTEPDLIIHAAAYTDVDGCERDPALATLVNTDGAANIARIAQDMGVWMIGVGTDFVFSGTEGAPYAEDAPPNPISVYGSSKLAGEIAILEANSTFAIARTAWLYGGSGKHFPRTVLTMLARNGRMDVVDDEFGSPTYAGDLAQALVKLLPHRPSGIFHLANAGSTSRFGLAQKVATVAGQDPNMVIPVSSEWFLEKFPLPARRPANSTLLNLRAAQLGVTLPNWQNAIERYVPSLKTELAGQGGTGR